MKLRHSPRMMPTPYRPCTVIELLDAGAVFYTEHHDGEGFVMGGLAIHSECMEHKVAELASYTDNGGVLHVRYRFSEDDDYQFFSTNAFVVWS